MGLTGTPGTTEWMVTEDSVFNKALEDSTQTEASVLIPTPSPGVSNLGYNTAEHGNLPPEESAGGGSKVRAQYKPLKHWKRGEYYKDVEQKR